MTLRPPCAGALRRRLALFSLFAILLALPAAAGATSPGIVISQVYGGGGNAGATYKNDFVELFNRGAAPVNVTGWSVQYAASAGTTWQVTTSVMWWRWAGRPNGTASCSPSWSPSGSMLCRRSLRANS